MTALFIRPFNLKIGDGLRFQKPGTKALMKFENEVSCFRNSGLRFATMDLKRYKMELSSLE